MERIGKLRDIPWERDFEWTIEDFSSLSEECDICYSSPSFSFAGGSWCLRIYPNGKKDDESIGHIDLYLVRERQSFGSPIRMDYSLFLKTSEGMTVAERNSFTDTFIEDGDYTGWRELIKRSEFLEKGSELGQPVALTVICTMKYLHNTDDGNCQVFKCTYCEKECDAETVSFHEEKCLDKSIKCPECYDNVGLRGWYKHDCQKFKAEALEKLSDDLKELMINGNKRDTIIKVRGVDFLVHRDILIARSSYFSAMFKSNMKEKHTGVVSINDCKPDIFRSFTHFIYTGKAGKLSSENVCDLYEIADKYQEDHLKKECLHFMMKSLSDDVFCDYIVLALKYEEKEMYAKAVEFFGTKPREIARSAKWHSFVKEYPTQASELFIETLDQQNKFPSKNILE